MDEDPARDADAAAGQMNHWPGCIGADTEAERELRGRAVGERDRCEQLATGALAQKRRLQERRAEGGDVPSRACLIRNVAGRTSW